MSLLCVRRGCRCVSSLTALCARLYTLLDSSDSSRIRISRWFHMEEHVHVPREPRIDGDAGAATVPAVPTTLLPPLPTPSTTVDSAAPPAPTSGVCPICRNPSEQAAGITTGFCSQCLQSMIQKSFPWPSWYPHHHQQQQHKAPTQLHSESTTSTTSSTSSETSSILLPLESPAPIATSTPTAIITSNDIQCPNHASGCNWQGERHFASAHLAVDCQSHSCPNRALGCSWTGTVGAALVHQADGCSHARSGEDERQPQVHTTTSTTTTATKTTSSAPFELPAYCDNEKVAEAIAKSRVFAIDVGDRTFRATEQTLRRETGSVLDRLFSGAIDLPLGSYHLGFSASSSPSKASSSINNLEQSIRDQRVFIDCDATSFEHVLFWLRSYVCLSLSLSLSLSLTHSYIEDNYRAS